MDWTAYGIKYMIYVITEYKTKYRTSYEVQSECLLYNGRDECVCAGSVTNGMDDSIMMRLRLLLYVELSSRLTHSNSNSAQQHCHPREHHDDDCDFFPLCVLPQLG